MSTQTVVVAHWQTISHGLYTDPPALGAFGQHVTDILEQHARRVADELTSRTSRPGRFVETATVALGDVDRADHPSWYVETSPDPVTGAPRHVLSSEGVARRDQLDDAAGPLRRPDAWHLDYRAPAFVTTTRAPTTLQEDAP